MREAKRFLGLELAGAKNQKTALAALEFYPREKKVFLLDIYEKISPHEGQTGDEALLELIAEVGDGVQVMGVNVPLELPPCITCTRKTCPLPGHCTEKSVKWMHKHLPDEPKNKARPITPYTQRPVEIWIRHSVFPKLMPGHSFEIDETLGGNRAPLTARMHFLKKHLKGMPLIEAWPKLSVSILAEQLNIPRRILTTYRHLEEGMHSREEILHKLIHAKELFIYERDMHKLSQSLAAFDAFICALTAWLFHQNQCAKIPRGFPVEFGWVQYPELPP